MHRTAALLLMLLGAFLASGPSVAAQTSPARSFGTTSEDGSDGRILEAVRTQAAPTIDGRLDEEVWARAGVASGFVQRAPDPGEPATERTEARIVHGADALYVGLRLHDSAPDSIAARLGRRDQSVYSDRIYVLLDSYNDNRTAFAFAVNPRGVRGDLRISNDDQVDPDWDAVWAAETRIDSLGWTAELRIPLSQLRHDVDQPVWGVNFRRDIARRDETSYWAATPPDAPGLVSRFGTLTGLSTLASARRLEIRPYSVARASRAPGDPEDPFHSANELDGSVGADFEYGLSSNLTLTGALNPDFGQVEADPSQVNLSAFETFYPEKRPFFLEGADIFDAGSPRLFYSRRIGRRPQGRMPGRAVHGTAPRATTILGAAKLTGRTAGGWSVGVLDAVTAAEEAIWTDVEGRRHTAVVEPLTNYGVVSLARNLRGGESTVGGLFTAVNRRIDPDDRMDFLHTSAYSGTLDARHRFGGGDYEIDGTLRGSHVRGGADAIARTQRAAGHYFQRPDGEHLTFDSERTSLTGWAGAASIARVGGGHWRWGVGGHAYSPDFEINDLGYHRASDNAHQYARLRYEQFESGNVFRRWNLGVEQWSDWSFGGERTAFVGRVSSAVQLQNYWRGHAHVDWELPALSTRALRGGPALRIPGTTFAHVHVYTDDRKALSFGFGGWARLEHGTGGRRIRLGSSLRLRPSPRMEVSLGPEVVRNTDAWQYVATSRVEGAPHYVFGRLEQTTASLTTRLSYTFTPDLTLEFYAQPFVSAGDYSGFMEVADPRAEMFEDRFRRFGTDELGRDSGGHRYRVDEAGDTGPGFSFSDPDYNLGQLRSNLVLRWQYRPGSTLFLVWNSGRTASRRTGAFNLTGDADALLGTAGRNVLLLKASYWLGL